MPRGKSASLPNPANNRSDLVTPAKAPKSAPGQAYGQRTGQEQSQDIIPIGAPEAPAPAAAPAAPQPAARVPRQPGELPWMGTAGSGGIPTTGLPNSAGAGPEALTGLGAIWHANNSSEQGTLQQVLAHLASQPNASSLTKSLAANAGVRRG